VKHTKAILVLFTFLFIFGATSVTENNVMGVDEDARNVEINDDAILSYESHDVIHIFNDTDFETQATNEMWSGDGSSDTPYLIQGYSINNDTHTSIYISDVSVYFEILDCLVTSTTPQNSAGIEIYNVNHGHIENCVIVNKNTGLRIEQSIGVSVVNCTMNHNAAGVVIEASNHTLFSQCYFTNTTTGSGFYQDNSNWTSITNSFIDYNGDYGVESYGSNSFTFTGNEVIGNDYAGLLVENSDHGLYQYNTISGNYEEGIILYNSHQTTFTENSIYDNDRYGVSLSGTNFGFFGYNIIHNNTLYGINYDTGESSVLYENTVYDNGWTNSELGAVASGINIEFVVNCSVIGNEVYNNSAHGIVVDQATNCTIDSNTVWSNFGIEGECGIYSVNADSCNFTSNIVYNNTLNGIYLLYSNDCILSYNVVYDNAEDGLLLENTNRTLIYYNDFGWNPTNAFSDTDSTYINYWDNGVVGNWWSDYSGTGSYTVGGPTSQQDLHPAKSLELGPASNAHYELGSMGNALMLTAQALNPWQYEILVDTQLVGTYEWSGGMITPSIDGLDVGVYNLTIRAFHISGHYLASSSTVTVVDTTPPGWVLVPTNQTITHNVPLSYQLQATDLSAIEEWIVNDTAHFTIIDGLLTNSTTLEVGYYHLNITVVDEYGNARTAVITVQVTGTDAPPADTTALMLVIGAGVAGLVVLAVVVSIAKKKNT
jgi:parallel beta-helix repeat protein